VRERLHIPLLFVTCVTTFTVLGMIDDRFGSHDIRGLRGHFQALLRGKLTTGAVKAIAGALVAIITALLLRHFAHASPRPYAESAVDALLIALAANAVNLLDRRPSRALKGYALLLLAAVAAGARDRFWLLIPVNMTALIYAPLDFRCRAMMGDAGSNTLGGGLGLLAALDLSLAWKVAAVVLLLAFNFGSEKYSYSKWIESSAFLRWADRLGVAD
jgi:UDP-N-acetylmuramyl pentapeptide phosphotransferase/UDP-N-acetylglucosamine-1-phosphate transferase